MGVMNGLIRNAGNEFPDTAVPTWDAAPWMSAETLEIGCFRPESSSHRPKALARLLYDARGVHGMFRVEDRYVLCRRTEFQDPVWKDSCVELFIQPKPDRGYFNFEFNCGGALLCSHIIDHERTPDGFKNYEKLPAELGRTVRVRSSLPRRIDPEITEPLKWTLQFFIPFALFEQRVGTLGRIQGQIWRGNLFKCAEENSHPHWASWLPVDEFNFHRPNCFGALSFE
jgi:hypothetical protein